ncbi:MAG TPA: hypothetical protein VFQ85_11715 [Mycobacteriales bacterium]|jgi:hypothetical protein|nr:hypothetical protein [Mycobacteriales bacterium]
MTARTLLVTAVAAVAAFLPSPVSADPGLHTSAQLLAVQPSRCSYPGGMYAGTNDCKYAQAHVATRCTDGHTTATGTSCWEKQVLRFSYRGGTADATSPTVTGGCRYGGDSGMRDWAMSYFTVRTARGAVYTAPTAHYGLHTNCDVEAGPYYGTPNPITLREDAVAHYSFVHRCPASPTCASFSSEIDFAIPVPS